MFKMTKTVVRVCQCPRTILSADNIVRGHVFRGQIFVVGVRQRLSAATLVLSVSVSVRGQAVCRQKCPQTKIFFFRFCCALIS